MAKLTEMMEAARAKSRCVRLKPSDLIKPPEPPPRAGSQSVLDFLAPHPAAPSAHSIEEAFPAQSPLIIADVAPCPHCGCSWAIESYGPSGQANCWSCKAIRTDRLIVASETKIRVSAFGNGRSKGVDAKTFLEAIEKQGLGWMARYIAK